MVRRDDRPVFSELFTTVAKHFQGDVIQILNASGRVLGCGRARYDHLESERLMGQRGQKPLIHYDYLYLVD